MAGPAESEAIGPFFPAPRACDALLERAAELVAEGHRLEAASGPIAAALRPLSRVMNACCSSELDGCAVAAPELERAAAGDVDADPERARAQRLARAHIAAEAALAAALPTKRVGLYAPEFVQCIHAELQRAAHSGTLEPAAGAAASVPGAWRERPAVGRDAAEPSRIPEQLEWWQAAYGRPFGLEQALLSAVCAPHRLSWVRPFEHGNDRSVRLHTLLVLGALGVTQGLWSPYRGMAHDREGYLARLRFFSPRDVETARRELESFAGWLLEICIDEARAARERLDAERLKGRMSDLLAWLGARPWVIGSERSVIKPDALEALHYTAITGPVERARFIAMLGLQHRTGRRVLSSLIDFGLLVSESSRAPVRFNLPLASLRFLFPGFWPGAAAADEPGSAAASSWPHAVLGPGGLGLAGSGG